MGNDGNDILNDDRRAAPAGEGADLQPLAVRVERIPITAQMVAHTRPRPPLKRVHVVVNPAAGQEHPILRILNDVFREKAIEWTVSITQREGDGTQQARQAAEAGVDAVAVYGGDGTVVEVASGLAGTDIPLAILPGGTANVLTVELGIPRDLREAAELMTVRPGVMRGVDMGQTSRGNYFFHLGMGLEGEMVQFADREAKNSSGILAYVFGVLREVGNHQTSHYKLTLDGEVVEVDGINCMITNFGSLGIAGLKLAHTIDMSDGLLDVLVIQNANLRSVLQAAASVLRKGEVSSDPILQWQVREVRIEADPPQVLVRDGDLIELDEIAVQVVSQAVKVIVPADEPDEDEAD